MPVSQLDESLPRASFVSWFNQIIGPEAGVVWQLTECGERINQENGAGLDLRACAEADAILADGRKVVVVVSVGTFKKGISGDPVFYSAVIEQNDQLYAVRRLRDLPQVLHPDKASAAKPPPARTSASRFAAKVLPIRLPNAPGAAVNLRPMSLVILGSQGVKPKDFALPTAADLPEPAKPTIPRPRPPETRVSLEPPGPEKFPAGLVRGRAIVKAKPAYPKSAGSLDAIFRTVEVSVIISEQGRVIKAKVLRGHPILHVAAIDAARKWVFEPTTLNGKAVKTESILTFVFDLNQR